MNTQLFINLQCAGRQNSAFIALEYGIDACLLLILNRAVDPSEALKLPGVKTYIGADDVPGHNATGPVIFDEEVFASEKVILI